MKLSSFYHEKQNLAHCAIHTLNNLFQSKWISYSDMKRISIDLYQLDKQSGLISTCSLNPYISSLPYVGYFDIACIIKALEDKNCEITQHVININDLKTLNLPTLNDSSLSSSQSFPSSSLSPSSNNLGNDSKENSISINFIGLIVNEINSSFFGLWNSRHWFSIIYDHSKNLFVNLDSMLDAPDVIGNEIELKHFLQTIMQNHQAQIFVVSKKS